MRILHGVDGLRQLPPGAAMSVGNFDGIHRGHTRILQLARELARGSGGRVAVVTFEPHPLTVLRPQSAPPRLTPLALKQELLSASGVDDLVVLAPEPAVLNLTAGQFWTVLLEAGPRHLIEGESFNFGKDRGGTIQRLREWAAGSAIDLHVVSPVEVPLLDLSVVEISSSLIRWLIANGRVRDAAICLGRPYAVEGVVVEGFKRGRTIGIPTANLRCVGQLVPMDGVYAGRCEVDGRIWPAAVSVGVLPTFGDGVRQIEAHLIGFTGDLYGRSLRIELVDWVRDQRKFPGIEALKGQLSRDIRQVRCTDRRDAAQPIATP